MKQNRECFRAPGMGLGGFVCLRVNQLRANNLTLVSLLWWIFAHYFIAIIGHCYGFQVSLSRMVMDIMKFVALYVLVLFAFSCGKIPFYKAYYVPEISKSVPCRYIVAEAVWGGGVG